MISDRRKTMFLFSGPMVDAAAHRHLLGLVYLKGQQDLVEQNPV